MGGQSVRAAVSPAPGLLRHLAISAPWLVYLSRRLIQGVLVAFGAAVISFVLIHIAGDPAVVLAGGYFDAAQVHQLSHQLGYDRPMSIQFVDYFGHLLRGDLGQSFRFHQSAASLVFRALPNTLLLVTGAVLLASVVAVAVSVTSVLNREAPLDHVLRRSLIVAQGVPEFWLGLLLLLIFAVRLGWLPSLGFSSWKSPILPILTLALPLMSILTRLLRSQLLDLMESDFVTTLRAKGLTELEIVLRHTLLNAMIPFVTYLALQLGWLVGGTIVVEAVFTWPGIGTLILSATKTRDLQVIQAIVLLIAVVFVLLNLAADLLVVAIDPRIRVGRKA